MVSSQPEKGRTRSAPRHVLDEDQQGLLDGVVDVAALAGLQAYRRASVERRPITGRLLSSGEKATQEMVAENLPHPIFDSAAAASSAR